MKKTFSLITFSFSLSIFVGSFLLFQVQPLIGKYLLPWFGGGDFVWTTALLFFQVFLLFGYLYSYLITKFHIKLQAVIHSLLLVVCGIVVLSLFYIWHTPILVPLNQLPEKESLSPVWQVLTALVISIGLPYFLLSTTSTLLQKWFSFFDKDRLTYSLYSLSNTGSLLGLVTYPFFIEPYFSLRAQGHGWSIFFLVYVVLFFTCCMLVLFNSKLLLSYGMEARGQKLSLPCWHYVLWLFLPAVSSLILLAITARMLLAIAPIPFLWIIPLTLYLLSFILCFSKKNFYARNFFLHIFFVLLPLVAILSIKILNLGVVYAVVVHSLFAFTCFMLCHGEVYSFRPKSSRLNIFYLLIATGSATGASVVAIIAPVFFQGLFWEYYLGVCLVCGIGLFVLFYYRTGYLYNFLLQFWKIDRSARFFMIAFCGVFLFFCTGVSTSRPLI